MVLQVYKTLEPAVEVISAWWKSSRFAPHYSVYSSDYPHCLVEPTHRPPIIAGGSIVRAFLGIEVSANTNTDFDLYFINRAVFEDFGNYLAERSFTKNDGKEYPNSVRDSYKNDTIILDTVLVEDITFEFGERYDTRNRQIVDRLFESFDLDISKVAIVFNDWYGDTPKDYEPLEPKLVYADAGEFIEQLNGKPMTFKVCFTDPKTGSSWEERVEKTMGRLDKYSKLGLTKPENIKEPYIYYIEHLERKLKELK